MAKARWGNVGWTFCRGVEGRRRQGRVSACRVTLEEKLARASRNEKGKGIKTRFWAHPSLKRLSPGLREGRERERDRERGKGRVRGGRGRRGRGGTGGERDMRGEKDGES